MSERQTDRERLPFFFRKGEAPEQREIMKLCKEQKQDRKHAEYDVDAGDQAAEAAPIVKIGRQQRQKRTLKMTISASLFKNTINALSC